MRLNLRSLLPEFVQSLLLKLTKKPNVLTYDCEIANPIRYDSDWRDWEYMGLSVLGCHADWLPAGEQWLFFTAQNKYEGLQELIEQADEIVGYNSLEFDDNLAAAHGIRIETTYDLMQEVRKAAGEPATGFCTPGYKLVRLAQVNLGTDLPQVRAKSESSPNQVPDLWQEGQHYKVIKHCLNDVYLTRELYDRRRSLRDPVVRNRVLNCDPNSIHWQEIKSAISYYFSERIVNLTFRQTEHWSGANILQLRLAISESLLITFPVWMYPIKTWRGYTGIPFKKSGDTNPYLTDRERELNVVYKYADKDGQDPDPIPF